MIGRTKVSLSLLTAFLMVAVIGATVSAEPQKDAPPQGQPQMQLPPGWTMEDVQACMAAGTPGKMHEHLAACVGTWEGKNKMWMFPGADPVDTRSTAVISPMLDGRFFRCEISGEMPGMGPYNGFAIYGFDNVSQEFVATWIDNCGTGMATGTGVLSEDGKTLTWSYKFNCPMTKKSAPLREVQTITSPNTRTLEVFATDPKSGREYKMMQIELTRKSGTAAAAAGTR